ncbi:MAG: hypothetical protein AB8C46_04580 [Burkholderiaceae bacterium]
MKTSKVTTLVLMTLVWWAFSPDTAIQSDFSVESMVSQSQNDNFAVNTLP